MLVRDGRGKSKGQSSTSLEAAASQVHIYSFRVVHAPNPCRMHPPRSLSRLSFAISARCVLDADTLTHALQNATTKKKTKPALASASACGVAPPPPKRTVNPQRPGQRGLHLSACLQHSSGALFFLDGVAVTRLGSSPVRPPKAPSASRRIFFPLLTSTFSLLSSFPSSHSFRFLDSTCYSH